jgi:hypothetical protein
MSNESQHWYTRDGQPCHTQICKSKKAKNPTRPTNLGDAKKLDLLPSVSAYTKMLAAPSLENYKMENLAGLCFDNPPHPGEDRGEWVSSMLAKGKEDGKGAADIGTLIHAAVAAEVTGMPWDRDEEVALQNGDVVYMRQLVDPAMTLVRSLGLPVLQAEGVLVNNKSGYAGTTDLILGTKEAFAVIDFKSKRTKLGKKVIPIDTHPMQLMAYGIAYPGARLDFVANIYISTTEVGRVELVKYDEQQMKDAWDAFLACASLYRFTTGYDARSLQK